MTSFDTLEISEELSRPFDLYVFALGTAVYYYTSTGANFLLDSETVEATAISRGSIAQGPEERRRTLTVKMPATTAFARNYLGLPPGLRATLSIIRLQRGEIPAFNTRALQFKGVVENVSFTSNGDVAEIVCRTIEGETGKTIPVYTYQSLCGHMLYGPGCLVNPDLHKVTREVTAVSGSYVTIAGAVVQNLTGGFAKPSGENEYRLILSQVGNVLRLLAPFQNTPINANVELFLGCDHEYVGDCFVLFQNQINFGGWKDVPNKNIFQTGIR